MASRTYGWQCSNLIILAARPAQGKTSLGMQLALAAAATLAHPIVFSLEMSRDELGSRLLCSESRVDSVRMWRGLLAASEWGQLLDGAKRLQMEQGLGMIVIDYLQLLHSHKHIDSRQQEVSEISRDLKILAKELNVPVIALSKLSIAVEHRQVAQ